MGVNIVLSLALTILLCPQNLEAVKCYSCAVQASSACSTVVDCPSYQECNLKSIVLSNGNARYLSGCKNRTLCAASSIVGRRNLHDNHHDKRSVTTENCCDVDYCNGPPGAVAVTTPTPAPTPAPTATQTTAGRSVLCSQR